MPISKVRTTSKARAPSPSGASRIGRTAEGKNALPQRARRKRRGRSGLLPSASSAKPLCPLRGVVLFLQQRVGDGGVVATQRAEVVGERMPRDPLVMAAVEGRRQAEMRGAGLFPE